MEARTLGKKEKMSPACFFSSFWRFAFSGEADKTPSGEFGGSVGGVVKPHDGRERSWGVGSRIGGRRDR